MKTKLLIIFIFIFIINNTFEGTKKKVEKLFEIYDGDIYSGYLNTLIEGNELFYIFMPSQSNQLEDQVILWLNGGPGCSSLFGMLSEIGAVVTDNFSGKFKKNEFSWNLNANLLFIEQPAGVGFSKSSDIGHNWTDVENARNLFAGVKDFFNEYPELKGRDFYITGESYAGIFIPHLSVEILQDTSDKINLKGFLIGNALTDPQIDYDRSLVEFGFWRGLLSIETYDAYQRNCPHLPDELRPDIDFSGKKESFSGDVSKRCNEIRKKISDDFYGSDMYGIYRLCPNQSRLSPNESFYLNQKHTIKNKLLKGINKILKKNINNKGLFEPEEEVWPYSCGEDLLIDHFLNQNSTKEKLNVADQSVRWFQCADLSYEWSDSIHLYNSTLLNYPDLKMWLLSGTEDAVISTIGTMRWIDKIGFNVEKKWSQWKEKDQVSGYVQTYKEGLVLVTIKGAGHMSPQDKRSETKFVLDSFIKGVLPSEIHIS